MHVGESEVTARMVVGELFVIHAKHVHDRRMPVMNVQLPIDCLTAIVVGCSIGETTLGTTTTSTGC